MHLSCPLVLGVNKTNKSRRWRITKPDIQKLGEWRNKSDCFVSFCSSLSSRHFFSLIWILSVLNFLDYRTGMSCWPCRGIHASLCGAFLLLLKLRLLCTETMLASWRGFWILIHFQIFSSDSHTFLSVKYITGLKWRRERCLELMKYLREIRNAYTILVGKSREKHSTVGGVTWVGGWYKNVSRRKM
jgi:hypothetical protein